LEKQQPLKSRSQTRNWTHELVQYREPDQLRSVLEILVTVAPLVLLWLLAWLALSISYLLTLAFAVLAGGFLVRLFMIQHDCGHGSFFRQRGANDWVGRVIGVLTLTPYDIWRQSHATHHATSGNLDRRGIGDINTLTVREYLALPRLRRLNYRLYRHPLILFGVGPTYLFLLRNRLPSNVIGASAYEWLSALATNAAIAGAAVGMMLLVGIVPFLLVHLPIVLVGSTIGVWLFFVQHQFEDTFWADSDTWLYRDAALYGSSHYDLPLVLRWFTANIGIHHVHHLYSRIPFYRLGHVLCEHPELADVRRLTLLQSFANVRLSLWDERSKQLVSFRRLRGL